MVRRKKKWNRKEPIHYYLAMIAAEIRRGWVKNKHAPKIEHHLLNFETGGPLSEEEKKKRMQASKEAWGAGMDAAKAASRLRKKLNNRKILKAKRLSEAPPSALVTNGLSSAILPVEKVAKPAPKPKPPKRKR